MREFRRAGFVARLAEIPWYFRVARAGRFVLSERMSLRPSDQLAIWFLVVGLWVLLSATCVHRVGSSARLVSIDRVASREVLGGIDVNRADWSLLAALPGLGEALARRMVETRERLGGFARVEELLRVEGLGPKTLNRVRAHVRVEDLEVRGTAPDG